MQKYSAVLCLAIVLPSFGADAGKGKNDWSRLAQVAGVQTVTVDLKSGRTVKGNIVGVRPDSLSFVEQRKLKRIELSRVIGATVSEAGRVREIEGRPQLQKGQNVELKLRDGGVTSGLVREVNQGAAEVQLLEESAAVRIMREDVVRVIKITRWKSALIGAGAGLGLGALVARGKSDLGHAREFALAGAVLGSIGIGIGAAIGAPTVIYEAPPH